MTPTSAELVGLRRGRRDLFHHRIEAPAGLSSAPQSYPVTQVATVTWAYQGAIARDDPGPARARGAEISACPAALDKIRELAAGS